MDARIFNESGKGYWMCGFGCLRAEGENRPSRPCHIVILNDQGGGVMNVSENVVSTLRAQMKHHEPIICAAFMGGQGAKARTIAYCDDGTTPTLKSVLSGGNTVPDVVYEVRDGQREMPESVGSAKQTTVHD